MRIIVHIGMPKTGSSAIQEYLYSVREQMPEDGFLYPDLDHASHWKLAVALAGETMLNGEAKGYLSRRAKRAKMEVAQTLESVADQIRALDPRTTLILSHENFSARTRAAQLCDYLRSVVPDAEIHAIGYVRNPVSFYPSGIQQNLKGMKRFSPPSDWESSHPTRAAGARAAFGDRCVLRVYDRSVLDRGDVVEDFRDYVEQVTGRALPGAPKTLSTNESMSGPVCAVLHRYAQKGDDGRATFGELRRALSKFSKGRKDPKLRLPEGWDQVIAVKNHKAWNSVVDWMPYDAELKARLRLSPPRDAPFEIELQAVHEWIDSYLDPQFVSEFSDDLARAKPVKPQLVKQWRAWLAEQVPQPAGAEGRPD